MIFFRELKQSITASAFSSVCPSESLLAYPKTKIPASLAAVIPLSESSMTIQFSLGVFAKSAAFSKISGCGLEAVKSAPLIFAEK